MAKDDSQSVTDLNTCVSTSNGPRPAKETTFREWMVANQIGMGCTPRLDLRSLPFSVFR